MQSGTQEIATSEKTAAGLPTLYIIKFLLLWFLSLIVVLAVTLLSDINWTRPYVERQLGEALNRKVELGKLYWSIGASGATIETRRLNIRELDGKPFLSAQDSELGISVMALLSRKLVITFIQADKADVRFVKTGANTWNFDDLLKPGPEIRLLQLTSAKMGLYDESSQARQNLDPIKLEKVELKLNFPHKDRKRPFFLSFSLPSKGYSTTFTLDGLGVGELEKWQANQYTFKADAKRVNPRDLERLVKYVAVTPAEQLKSDDKAKPTTADAAKNQTAQSKETASAKAAEGLLEIVRPVKGLFDFAVKGEGTFDKGIKATFNTTADNVLIEHPKMGTINAGKTLGALTANLSKDKISWKDLILKLHGLELHSSGAVSDWQQKDPEIDANLKGNIPDIGVIQDILQPKPDAPKAAHGLSSMAKGLKPARLSGRAEIAIKIDGTANDTNIVSSVKTHNLAINEMLKEAHQKLPILCAIGLSNQAHIETDLKLVNADRVEIESGKLVGPGTNLGVTGWVDFKTDKSSLKIAGDRIALKDTAVAISTNEGAYNQVLGCIKLPGKNSFMLDGTASANATLTTDADRFNLDGKIRLNNASFALKDNSLKLDKVNGDVFLSQGNHAGSMTLSKFTGQMGDGNFQMDGRLSLTKTPLIDVTIHATRFDLKHLSSLMKMFQIQIPVLTERQLFGRVKDVVLKVTGTAFEPKIFFSAVPDDMYYQPPGLAKPVRAKAGVIVYDNDQLILREVAIISNGKTIITSLTIDKVSKECLVSRVKTKTDSIELADIHYYLSSTAMPPPLRKAYLDFLAQYKITGMQGKAYGDILCLIGPKGDATFDGLIGLYKAGATVSGYPLTKLEGIFAASGDQLLLQDLSGYLRGSKFSLDGYIDKYKSKTPTWRAEVTATLAPRELLELIPHLTEELKTAQYKVTSQGPLTLRTKAQGGLDHLKAQYSLIADKKDKMIIQGPFGKVYQPADTPLTLDGLISLDKHRVEIGDTHLLVGETLISLDGELQFPEVPEGEKAAPPIVNMTVKIPQKSPVKTLVAMVDPPIAKDIKGTIAGYLTVDGDLHNPRLLSDISISDLDAKPFNIAGLNGRLRSGGAPKKEGDAREESTESILEIDSVKIRQLPVTNLKAQVALDPGSKVNGAPLIAIDKGEARLADGLMKFEAKFDPSENGIWAKASFTDISASRVGDELVGSPDEISGKGQASIEVKTKGDDYHKMIQNLKGHGTILVEDGVVARFSSLQTRLTQYNLLTQGIFGFNFNNLLQSFWPVRTGEFNSLNNTFSFEDGVLKVEELRFSGNDMRIWGRGTANLENNKVQLEMAGKIPRVQGSMLGGSLGTASRNITLQKMMKTLTFGKLQSLPALPVLGAIATDKPRTFMFTVDSTFDNPKLIARSIEKSFKWLPNKPEATAHPVPGVVSPM